MLAAVSATVQSILGTVPTAEQPLMEAGLDSLAAVELRNALSTRFGVPELPATLIFDYPTMSALTGFLVGEHCQLICRIAVPSNDLSQAILGTLDVSSTFV